jgi:hypothetical protein
MGCRPFSARQSNKAHPLLARIILPRPVGAAIVAGIGTAASIHFERGGRGPRTPGEIDGATQFSDLSARCGQFQALAFPRCEPCLSRCPALAGLVRARTSDDIRPRAPCTPPPKSLPPPGLATSKDATRITYGQRRFEPWIYFAADSDLCATGSMRTLRSCDGLADRRPDSIIRAIDVAGGAGGPGMGG